jgi:hypothetical protein
MATDNLGADAGELVEICTGISGEQDPAGTGSGAQR